MSRKKKTIWAGGIVAVCGGLAVVSLSAWLHGYDARQITASNRLVVHEWGTFTSFAGSDGVNLEFRPLVTKDLPPFVLNAGSQASIPLLKEQLFARQRMETPVTYFYTDVPRTVTARVEFPQGLLTEWYPVVKNVNFGMQFAKNRAKGLSYLDWGPVRLTPQEQFANVRVRHLKTRKAIPAFLPTVTAEDHYGRARETDSAIVETVDMTGSSHFEKFLFYRGVGNFELPLKLVAGGKDQFEVINSGNEASGALLLVRIEQGRVRFTRHASVGPHATLEMTLPTAESTVDQLAAATVRELSAAGLYEKESLAMVNTWRTSWFGENGTRLLYLVPGKLTDELLPLSIEPAPDEQVRVLVGRLEVFTPDCCQRLIQAIAGDDDGEQPAAETVATQLEALGRFAEPAVQYAMGQTADATKRQRLATVLQGLRTAK